MAGLWNVEFRTIRPIPTRGTSGARPDDSAQQSKAIDSPGHFESGVLAGPDRFEAEPLGGLGELDDARPGAPRLPALELVEVALRQDQSDLHRPTRSPRRARQLDAGRPQVVDQLVDALVGVDEPGHPADDAVDAELDPLGHLVGAGEQVVEVVGHDRRQVLLRHQPLAADRAEAGVGPGRVRAGHDVRASPGRARSPRSGRPGRPSPRPAHRPAGRC